MMTNTHDHSNRCWWNHDEARWECAAAPAERPLVDVRDMIVVHGALLREFRLASAAVARTAIGDRRQAAIVGEHVRFVCDLLHHHHEGEDALLWPILRERATSSASALIDDAEAQHEHIDTALADVRQRLDAWEGAPGEDNRDLLAERLTELHALLRDHLDFEERALLPLAAATLTGPEWHAIGETAVAATPKSNMLLMFGMIAYEADPAVLRGMLKAAPPPARVVLKLVAPGAYARRARKVHATARP